MNELQPFTKEPKCPKCVGKGWKMEFCWLTDGREYLKITCEECGYTWNMETADKDKKELILEEPSDHLPEKLVEVKINDSVLEKKIAEVSKEIEVKEDDETKEAPVEERE